MNKGLAKIIGHRGACGYAPENTLASMTKAKDCGATMVELDVQMLGNQNIAVIHDDILERTTNGNGDLRSQTLAQLQQLDAGSWFDNSFTGETIQSLGQMIQHINKLDMGLIVEIKPGPEDKAIYAQNVMATVTELWQGKHPLIYFSESIEILHQIRKALPDSLTGLVIDKWESDYLQQAVENDVNIFVVDHTQINEALLQQIKTTNKQLACYTVNDKQRAEYLLRIGVDSIITDFPDILNIETA